MLQDYGMVSGLARWQWTVVRQALAKVTEEQIENSV
jgi:hypothetical protein